MIVYDSYELRLMFKDISLLYQQSLSYSYSYLKTKLFNGIQNDQKANKILKFDFIRSKYKKITNNQYRINNWYQIGHGCFLFSFNGDSFSHSHKQHNCVTTDFRFDEQDVMNVMVNGDELFFVNKTQGKEHKMKIKLTAEEWKQACFCFHLNTSNNNSSAVQIMK